MHRTPEIFKQPIKTLGQLFMIARFCCKVRPLFSVKYFYALLGAVRLCREGGFLPDEAFRLGLFNPNLSTNEIFKYISRKKLTKIQESVNPISWAPLIKNKGIFYRYCMALGIPIPKLYAVFFRKTAGWSYNDSVLKTQEDWEGFFNIHLPSEFVIKPTQSACGHGVNFFTRTDKGFIDAFARPYTARQLYDTLLSNPEYDSFVIQQRLKNHLELIRLSGIKLLQTIRIITLTVSNNQYYLLHAHLKLITGKNVVDNFEHGLSGNISAMVSLDNGLLKPAITIAKEGSGIKTISNHPKTGISFDQFQLPLWPETCKLVKETAQKLQPIRTIAWDVALTPDGPIILEANIWWNPPNEHRRMDVILEAFT